MTKREFDARTKENWGGPRRMASDERANYREGRHKEHHGSGASFATYKRVDRIQRRKPGAFAHRGCVDPGMIRHLRSCGLEVLPNVRPMILL